MSTRLWTGTAGDMLRSYWWLAIIRGIVAILFGIAVLARPAMSVGVLLMLFGAFALASGIMAVISSISLMAHHKQWWAMLVEGLVGIAIGLITFYWPAVTALSVLVLVAIWAIIIGVFQFVGSASGFGPSSSRWLLAIAGILSVILGILLLARPAAGLLTIVWFLGIYAILWGIDQIVLGFQLRHLDRWLQTRAA